MRVLKPFLNFYKGGRLGGPLFRAFPTARNWGVSSLKHVLTSWGEGTLEAPPWGGSLHQRALQQNLGGDLFPQKDFVKGFSGKNSPTIIGEWLMGGFQNSLEAYPKEVSQEGDIWRELIPTSHIRSGSYSDLGTLTTSIYIEIMIWL